MRNRNLRDRQKLSKVVVSFVVDDCRRNKHRQRCRNLHHVMKLISSYCFALLLCKLQLIAFNSVKRDRQKRNSETRLASKTVIHSAWGFANARGTIDFGEASRLETAHKRKVYHGACVEFYKISSPVTPQG